MPLIKFVDMFSGIGGFREGLTRAGGFACVGHCEIDKYANRSYNALFDTKGEWFIEDARKADPSTMPDFQLLCGGFPCQTFSIAGSRKGFGDPRGTLFFELARLAEARKPPYLLFENVPYVQKCIRYILHDLQGGTTELEELQKKLADARQEFDRLLDLSLECDASFLDEKLKHTSEEIDSLQKQIDQLTASQQKAANPNLQLTASDFHITEYSDAIVARIIERIDIVSANEIKIEFIGGYTVTAPLRS